MTRFIYPEKLESFLSEYPNYIPYPFTKNDELKIYRRYYNTENQILKILEIYNIFDTKYYYVKINNTLQAVLPHPVNDIIYELVPLYNYNLLHTNIIDSNEWYTGAEIKYWFFVNNIDINNKYKDFKEYLYNDGKSKLNELTLYKILYNNHYAKIVSKQ